MPDISTSACAEEIGQEHVERKANTGAEWIAVIDRAEQKAMERNAVIDRATRDRLLFLHGLISRFSVL